MTLNLGLFYSLPLFSFCAVLVFCLADIFREVSDHFADEQNE